MIDPARVGALVREVAEAEILPRYQALRDGDIREKGPGDYVTAADLASEAALTRRLRDLLPGSLVLGEEAAAADAGLFGLLDGAEPVWIIDPVDGTINFAKGVPGFAVIVALVAAGAVRMGWILDPLEGTLVAAERGAGAWRDGTRLAVDGATPVAAMTGAAYGTVPGGPRMAEILARSGRIGGIANRMSSGIEYLSLALGRSHFALSSRSLPWDHAAGVLIAQEAGATACFVGGAAYDPRIRDRGVLAAASPIAWQTIQAILETPATRTDTQSGAG